MTRKLNNINRTATFAWSPGHQLPMIATGTMSGAMDDTFSNASELEIFKLDLNPESSSLQTSYKVSTNSRFNKLAWGHATTEKPYGIIAGGMESGELELWDPAAILEKKSASDALILRNSTHTGTLRTLDFNMFQTNLLASAGSNAEVYIWDLNNPNTPYTPGARSSRMDNISSVAWNCQVQHIVSTASTNGYTVVWDLRNKKEVMTLAQAGQSTMTGGKGSISSIAWHPNIATQIVTASDDDHNPIISLWDLRHAHSPEKTLAGHTKGVMDVSWCRQDSDLLISSGKDCKTLCWNPNSGEFNGELYSNNKWTFEVDWCPRNPDLLASSSFDGSINVLSIQGSQDGNTTPSQAPISDNPFDAALLTAAPSIKTFELKDPPKWLRRPVGASFGFSGKLVTFNNKLGQVAITAAASAIPGQASAINIKTISRPIKITTIETDPEIVKRAEQLESATNSDVDALIEDRIQHAGKDKVDWEVLKTLFSDNAREQLVTFFGFEKEQVMAAATALLDNKEPEEESSVHSDISKKDVKKESSAIVDSGEKNASIITNTASTLFGESSQDASANDSFFGQVLSQDSSPISAIDVTSPLVEAIVKNNRPFNLYPDGSDETDRLITHAIVLGDFESAVNVCLATERYSDALILSICGGGELLARTQKVYFETQSKKFSYLRLLEGIVQEDLNSIVRDADLKEWASILVILCTFADSKDFGTLCEVLGDRLLADAELYKNATLFYLASGNLEKVSSIWISQFEQESHLENSYGVRLQELVEKVTIFRKAIEYEDNAALTESGEYVLSQLYDTYCEYAEFMAAQGKLGVALKYISLTPPEYVATKSRVCPASVVRDRVFHASANQATSKYQQPSFPFEKRLLSSKESLQQQKQAIANPSYVQTQQYNNVIATVQNPISVATMQPTTNYYAPTAPSHQQQYNPQNRHHIASPTTIYNNHQYAYGQPQQQQQQQKYGNIQPSSNTPPPPPPKATGAWNDPPMLASPKINKKNIAAPLGTANASSHAVQTKRVTTPFSNSPIPQQQSTIPPGARALGGPPPSSNTTTGAFYSAYQQPQQYQPSSQQLQQQQRATPPPPPPINAVAPSPMKRGPHHQ